VGKISGSVVEVHGQNLNPSDIPVGRPPRFQVFLANFLLRMRRNSQNSTSGQIFNPKFEILMSCFLFKYEFWWRFRQDLYVFCAKKCFRNANFSEYGG